MTLVLLGCMCCMTVLPRLIQCSVIYGEINELMRRCHPHTRHPATPLISHLPLSPWQPREGKVGGGWNPSLVIRLSPPWIVTDAYTSTAVSSIQQVWDMTTNDRVQYRIDGCVWTGLTPPPSPGLLWQPVLGVAVCHCHWYMTYW